jgi:NTP pyrophosphatase (non-canonical NTP hydrolase)
MDGGMIATAMTNDDLRLPDRPTLSDFQEYVRRMVRVRGFDKETTPDVFMLFLEECGELAKAARKTQNLKTDPTSKDHRVDLEAADVFIYLLDICNHFDIDLERAFREKEALNAKRTWS